MDVLISTGSLTPRSLADAAHLAQVAGADGLELLLNGHLLAMGPEMAREIAEEYRVPIRSVHPMLRLIRPVVHRHEDVLTAARFAAALPACRTVVMHASGGAGLHTEAGRAFLHTAQEATAVLAGTGARVAVENRGTVQPQPRQEFFDRPLNLYRVCEEWDLDLTFDTAHAASFGLHIVPTLDVIYPRLRNVHLSDRREDPLALPSGLLNALMREHQMPGEGALPLGTLLERLQAKQYRGSVTLELSPLAVGSWSLRRTTQRLTRAVQFVREHTTMVPPPVPPSRRPNRAAASADADAEG